MSYKMPQYPQLQGLANQYPQLQNMANANERINQQLAQLQQMQAQFQNQMQQMQQPTQQVVSGQQQLNCVALKNPNDFDNLPCPVGGFPTVGIDFENNKIYIKAQTPNGFMQQTYALESEQIPEAAKATVQKTQNATLPIMEELKKLQDQFTSMSKQVESLKNPAIKPETKK